MKLNKKLIWYSLPVLLGGFLIYKQLSRGKQKGQDVPPPPPTIPPSTSGGGGASGGGNTPAATYPLKKGSKNSTVGSLQSLLNTALTCKGKTLLVVDSNFGTKTETALFELTGKKSVANEADFNSVKSQLASLCTLTKNLDWAWKLVDAAKTGKFTNLVVSKEIKLYKVKQDFLGKWVYDTPSYILTMTPRNYSMQDYFVRSATADGGLRIEVWRGENKGMWITQSGTDVTSIKMV
jgi:hypothetical protein